MKQQHLFWWVVETIQAWEVLNIGPRSFSHGTLKFSGTGMVGLSLEPGGKKQVSFLVVGISSQSIPVLKKTLKRAETWSKACSNCTSFWFSNLLSKGNPESFVFFTGFPSSKSQTNRIGVGTIPVSRQSKIWTAAPLRTWYLPSTSWRDADGHNGHHFGCTMCYGCYGHLWSMRVKKTRTAKICQCSQKMLGTGSVSCGTPHVVATRLLELVQTLSASPNQRVLAALGHTSSHSTSWISVWGYRSMICNKDQISHSKNP